MFFSTEKFYLSQKLSFDCCGEYIDGAELNFKLRQRNQFGEYIENNQAGPTIQPYVIRNEGLPYPPNNFKISKNDEDDLSQKLPDTNM